MRIYKLGAIALIPFFLAACPDADPEPVNDEPVEEEREHQIGDEETVTLGEINDSGVTGDARFTVMGEQEVEAMVEIQDAVANATYQVGIYQGQDCDNVGMSQHELDAIQTNEMGNGASTTTLNVRLANLMDGNHLVAVYGERANDDDAQQNQDQDQDQDQQDQQDERPVACGEISEHGAGLDW